ncbi:MAG: hypothetical protein GY866_05845, partial [Proteobacteria bacterium]|nr:hypothetical protein [Pseudomonadota bacterium]
LREAMASCKTAEEAYRIVFEKDRFPFSLNLLIGDPTKIVAVQILPEEIRPTFVKKTVVQSNDFDYYDWLPKMRRPATPPSASSTRKRCGKT